MALRVLLADNSETIKKVIQLTLQEYQLDLRVVTLGVDVLDVALQFKPDIIFVDILLQKKSGYDVAKELKNNVNFKSTPVVLMWSGFMEFDEAKAKESMADARLEKPFDAETLKDLVNKLVIKSDAPKTAADIASFLDFPTPKTTPPTTTPKTKNDDPLKSLEDIQREAEKFNPEKIKQEAPTENLLTESSSKEDASLDDFEMQPLDKTTSFGMKKHGPISEDISQKTKSFVLNLPDDAGGEDIPLEIEKVENIEDMSFLLNPESVVGPNPLLKQETQISKKTDSEVTRVTDPATRIIPAPASAPKSAQHPEALASPAPPIPSPEDIERIVREEVREAIEKVVWQVVPELASQAIRKELDRLLGDGSGEEKPKS